jgi:hypothetical protein
MPVTAAVVVAARRVSAVARFARSRGPSGRGAYSSPSRMNSGIASAARWMSTL